MKNIVYYKTSEYMSELQDESVDLIITSPPYFNIKDYSKDGYQKENHSGTKLSDIGAIDSYNLYIEKLLLVWKECERVLKSNGKLCINVPLMPMLKDEINTHHNRHIFDLQSSIQNNILSNTGLFLMDLYVWNRTNSTKRLMFGSYPYPANFYVQNIIEFITIYVKGGKPINNRSEAIKSLSKLTQEQWIEYTSQIWNIPIPNKSDLGFGKHSAIMPEEIVNRLVRLYSYVGDLVLDPFTGSGTTLKVSYENGRNYVGYELYDNYKHIIDLKLELAEKNILNEFKKCIE